MSQGAAIPIAEDDLTYLIINVRVTNTGAPSSLPKWSAHYKSPTLDSDLRFGALSSDRHILGPENGHKDRDIILHAKDSIICSDGGSYSAKWLPVRSIGDDGTRGSSEGDRRGHCGGHGESYRCKWKALFRHMAKRRKTSRMDRICPERLRVKGNESGIQRRARSSGEIRGSNKASLPHSQAHEEATEGYYFAQAEEV